MTLINPPTYLQTGSYSARQDRLATAQAVAPQHGTGALAIRSGVRPSEGNAGLQVTQVITPSMAVTVAAGSAFIQAASATGGCYTVANDASYDVPLTPAHATLGRYDLVIAKIYDSEVSGSADRWALEVVAGTPAGSPVAPTAPSGSIGLATILVPAAATVITNASIADVRMFTTSLGGTVPANSGALPSTPYQGMPAYDTTNLRPTWYDGTSWKSWMEDQNLLNQLIIRCTSTTRPSSPVEGVRIYETDTQRLLVYTLGSWVVETTAPPVVQFVRKTTEAVRTSTLTVPNDPELILPVVANGVYHYQIFIKYIFTSTSGAALKQRIDVPSGSLIYGSANFLDLSSPDAYADSFNYTGFSGYDLFSARGVPSSTTPLFGRFQGVVSIGSTSGNFVYQWGNAIVSGGVTVQIGSYFRLERVA